MKKKILGSILFLAISAVAFLNVNFNTKGESTASISLDDIESMAACESIGWWDNDGNCVSNDGGTYFCKSDSWQSYTDCLQ